jgi:cyclophilin family peptidyl-prolyl cis-trans isomerase
MIAKLTILIILCVGSLFLFWVQVDTHILKVNNATKATLVTNFGEIDIQLNQKSPIGKKKFSQLVSQGYYDGTRIHRIVSDFMIQGGDPLSRNLSQKAEWGHGGPGFTFKDEIDPNDKMFSGTVGLVNNGPDSNGSQFFILTKDASWLSGQHTVLGKVVKGMAVVEAISRVDVGVTGLPNQDVIIYKILLK